MINNRQAGRRRGRGGQQQRSQGGNPGRPDNGNRIDNRARGNAAQLLEKYKTLARDAQMQGDRVNVEYYLQFADHYFRVLAETRARFEENGGQSTGRRPQGATLDDDDQDYEDEGDRGTPNERVPEQGYRQEQNGNDRGDRGGNPQYQGNGNGNAQRDDRGQRGDGGQRYDNGQRDDRNGRGANGYQNEPREAEPPRAQRPERDERPRFPRPDYRAEPRTFDQRPAEALPVEARPAHAQPDVTAHDVPPPAAEAAPEAPRRGRGRPRREATPPEPAGLDADRLPAALGLSAVVAGGDDLSGEDKPRRRRGRPPASATIAD